MNADKRRCLNLSFVSASISGSCFYLVSLQEARCPRERLRYFSQSKLGDLT